MVVAARAPAAQAQTGGCHDLLLDRRYLHLSQTKHLSTARNQRNGRAGVLRRAARQQHFKTNSKRQRLACLADPAAPPCQLSVVVPPVSVCAGGCTALQSTGPLNRSGCCTGVGVTWWWELRCQEEAEMVGHTTGGPRAGVASLMEIVLWCVVTAVRHQDRLRVQLA